MLERSCDRSISQLDMREVTLVPPLLGWRCLWIPSLEGFGTNALGMAKGRVSLSAVQPSYI